MLRRTRVKICCIASRNEAAMAAAAGADLLGLVGPMPSGPGVIDDRTAREVAEMALPWATPVLLTEFEEPAEIVEHAARIGARTVQIVRHVPSRTLARLAVAAPGLARIQVIHVEDEGALDLIPGYERHVNAFLLDSGRPAHGELGGTGRVHDWEISAEFVHRTARPVFLAGGLTPENVGEAIARVRPVGVDLCGGIRIEGALDRELLTSFLSAIRRADEEVP